MPTRDADGRVARHFFLWTTIQAQAPSGAVTLFFAPVRTSHEEMQLWEC
jgi:hypothetical protein